MSNKLVVILMAVLFVLVLGMGGGMVMIWTKLSDLNDLVASPEDGKNGARSKPEQVGRLFALDTFIVNLADGAGNRYLRVTMDMEVTGGKPAEDEMPRRIPQMRDAILMILSTKRYADLSTPEGKSSLREELTGAANGLLASGKIARIYFKEFVIQ